MKLLTKLNILTGFRNFFEILNGNKKNFKLVFWCHFWFSRALRIIGRNHTNEFRLFKSCISKKKNKKLEKRGKLCRESFFLLLSDHHDWPSTWLTSAWSDSHPITRSRYHAKIGHTHPHMKLVTAFDLLLEREKMRTLGLCDGDGLAMLVVFWNFPHFQISPWASCYTYFFLCYTLPPYDWIGFQEFTIKKKTGQVEQILSRLHFSNNEIHCCQFRWPSVFGASLSWIGSGGMYFVSSFIYKQQKIIYTGSNHREWEKKEKGHRFLPHMMGFLWPFVSEKSVQWKFFRFFCCFFLCFSEIRI